jgi:uncharacterized protein
MEQGHLPRVPGLCVLKKATVKELILFRFSPFRTTALLILFAVAGYIAMVASLYVLQRPLLYRASSGTPAPLAYGITEATEVTITSVDGTKLAGWYRAAKDGRPTILFFHGKGGHLGHRHNRWKTYSVQGFGILFFDYRGFGNSEGIQSEDGLRADSIAAYDWLRNQGVAAERIVLAGESLGSGLALLTAAERVVSRVSLMSGYSSIADVAAQRYWFAPVQLLISDRFDILPSARKIDVPVLLQHGELDRTIPIAFAEKLVDALKMNVTFVRLEGKGHNQDFGVEELEREITFLDPTLAQ